MPHASPSTGPSRRQLAAGLAWATPVVLLTTAVPAYAASGCPTVTGPTGLLDPNYDQWTFSVGAVPLPIGTKVTWTLTNLQTTNNPHSYAFTQVGTSWSIVGTSPASLAQNASTTWTLTSTAVISGTFVVRIRDVGQSVYNYRSTLTISFAGTSKAACPSITLCANDLNNVLGASCGAVAGAQRLAPRSRV
ncbi:MAG TPA: hypothetical protein P5181_08925 [Dermatophilaceae bacterium]|nr:hypothetical protein [Dermatophilaceae bacterium]